MSRERTSGSILPKLIVVVAVIRATWDSPSPSRSGRLPADAGSGDAVDVARPGQTLQLVGPGMNEADA